MSIKESVQKRVLLALLMRNLSREINFFYYFGLIEYEIFNYRPRLVFAIIFFGENISRILNILQNVVNK